MGLYSQRVAKATASQKHKVEKLHTGRFQGDGTATHRCPNQLDWVTKLQTAEQPLPFQRLTAQVIPFLKVSQFAGPA